MGEKFDWARERRVEAVDAAFEVNAPAKEDWAAGQTHIEALSEHVTIDGVQLPAGYVCSVQLRPDAVPTIEGDILATKGRPWTIERLRSGPPDPALCGNLTPERCQCGSGSHLRGPGHSDWCPLFQGGAL